MYVFMFINRTHVHRTEHVLFCDNRVVDLIFD